MLLVTRVTPCLVTLALVRICVAQPATTRPTAPQAAETQPDQPQPYWLRVSADRVNLRSRADRNSPAVARVDRDTVLQALGSEYGWHRIPPPEGVFSFVSARYVDEVSDTEGIVSVASGNLRVRVGSLLADRDPLHSEVQTLLPRGAEVRILGRQGDWLKIVPPPGVHLYVSDEYVERITPEVAARLQTASATASQPSTDQQVAQTQPAESPDLSGEWGQRLLLVEGAIQAEAGKPPLEQSWEPMLASLRPIAQQRAEPAIARLAQAWTARLQERQADQAALRAAREITRHEDRDRARLERELQQLRRARQGLDFTARGRLLRSSALPADGPGPLYQLEDPTTGQILGYLEFPADTPLQAADFLGHYVGVRGERRSDRSLGATVIRVADIEILTGETPARQPVRKTP